MITILRGAHVYDGSDHLAEGLDVAIEDDRIVEVGTRLRAADARIVELRGRALLPGLIDAHIHVYASSLDLGRVMRRPLTYSSHYAAQMLRHLLSTGFTSVRDCAGADIGLVEALDHGLLEGPRLFHGGRAITSTGGHADWRQGNEDPAGFSPCGCGLVDQRMAVVADGVDEVLKATREELRKGARHIKIMGSGGIASPNDPVHGVQYSDEEIRIVVEETARHFRYTASHCHPAAAILRCAKLGVRSIEHATLIDREAAAAVADAEAFVVPTLAVMAAMQTDGAAYGLSPVSLGKLAEIADYVPAGLEIMREMKLQVGFGTDLLGALHERNLTEFRERAKVFTPAEILRSATVVNARLLQQEGAIGCIAPGAYADLIVLERDPLIDLSVMEEGARSMPVVMKGGRFFRNTLD